jgi:diacylglycerol kinase family enzyme
MNMRAGPARRLLVIHNPTAGRRKRGKFERWCAALDRLGCHLTLARTEAPRHAIELARSADPRRFDAVAVAGGDGTINEAVNGLVGSPLPLALLPLGTANVLANELALPSDLERLAEIAAFAPPRSILPGEILAAGHNEPWRFLLMAGIGFDAEVVAHLDLSLKRRIGKGAYALGSLAQLARHTGEHFNAEIDGTRIEAASLVIARAHFYGGRFVLAPEARLDAPQLYAVQFPGTSRLATLRYMAAVVTGMLARQCDVKVARTTRIAIDGPEGAPVQVDGDVRVFLPARIGLGTEPVAIIA